MSEKVKRYDPYYVDEKGFGHPAKMQAGHRGEYVKSEDFSRAVELLQAVIVGSPTSTGYRDVSNELFEKIEAFVEAASERA